MLFLHLIGFDYNVGVGQVVVLDQRGRHALILLAFTISHELVRTSVVHFRFKAVNVGTSPLVQDLIASLEGVLSVCSVLGSITSVKDNVLAQIIFDEL